LSVGVRCMWRRFVTGLDIILDHERPVVGTVRSGWLDRFGTPFALATFEWIARGAQTAKCSSKGVESTVLTSSSQGVVIELSTQVINHEEGQTRSPTCLVDPS
jgi:hypothetical protein